MKLFRIMNNKLIRITHARKLLALSFKHSLQRNCYSLLMAHGSWLMALLLFPTVAKAHNPLDLKPGIKKPSTVVSSRSDCAQGTSRFDADINNVRASLLSSGDVWWDLTVAQYVVPKVIPGTGAKAVSSIFAGSVWIGGVDQAGNLKVAVQTYRTSTQTDFWPGPLTQNGTTNAGTCANWDKHFVVYATDIDSMLKLFTAAKVKDPNNPVIDCGAVPIALKAWPSTGNPYFFDINRFSLPLDKQGLAKFHDENGDGLYDPCTGDYPTIDIKGCNTPVYPDQMIFWIYNDNGGVHTQSARSVAVQMEIQVQAFAYKTNDELNDMTFQRYKLINRAKTDIDSTFFAMWIDFDLGCYTDDYIGCDTTRSLGYCYNQKELDGTTGCICDQAVATYCDRIPIIGVDYFRGPNDEFGRELGMSSFTYYNNGVGVGNPAAGTTDPATATEYYNYISGSWKDGTPFTFGGSGYSPNTPGKKVKYAFTDAPDNTNGWSMYSQGLPAGDRRIIQASGPFKLKPGAINELIIGLPWVPEQKYPGPSLRNIQEADDIAQALFDNCFKIFDGPDAPDVSFVELNNEIVALLSNKSESNNYQEKYTEKGLKIPKTAKDSLYRFQGYKIYQLHDGDVGTSELENPDRARLVAQVDIQDSVSKIYNWAPQEDPNYPGRIIFTPTLKVGGENKGIRHSFDFKIDQFATGDEKRLINNKKYYYTAIAYAFNQYAKFDEKVSTGYGQSTPYAVGRRNIGDPNLGGKPYQVMPRQITNVILNSNYGDGPIVTRLDGAGNGGNFINLSAETLAAILNGTYDGTATYAPGGAPINIKITDPLEVVDGKYTLNIKDSDLTDNVVDNTAYWELTNDSTKQTIKSLTTIAQFNEQVIAQFGFSISIAQVASVGTQAGTDKTNGGIASTIKYAGGAGANWLTALRNNAPFYAGSNIFSYIKNGSSADADYALDPFTGLSTLSPYFVPYYLCDYRSTNDANSINIPLISPAWQNSLGSAVRSNNSLSNLNNVDIVFTKDRTKWSRCVVVETATPYYYIAPNGPQVPTEGNATMFSLRKKASVGKESDGASGAKVDGDGTGMSWFPGYAIDVETGTRLNIFFGENSAFDPKIGNYDAVSKGINRDMIWNPSSQYVLPTTGVQDLAYSAFIGGQQYVYVTRTPYDSCKDYRDRFSGTEARKVAALRNITWTSLAVLTNGSKLLSFADGLIPNDATVKLRVNKAYSVLTGKGTNGSHPAYKFNITGKKPSELTAPQTDSSLNLINVVPNPYYGFSSDGYETSPFTTTIKITNLPAKSTITIYSLDGKFIRQFKRDESPAINVPAYQLGTLAKEIVPNLEWDLKNDKGVPVASGVYLINVQSPQGERTLKFFAINRQFDPSKL